MVAIQIATFLMVYTMNKNIKQNVKTIIIETVKIDTVYRDTCDSQFMKAILETECHYYSKKAAGKTIHPPVGDGGRAIGVFQMHEIYFKGCELAEMLDYSYEDMFDEKKAAHVFWSKMAVYAYKYNKEYKKLPTFEELASIHNAGYHNRHRAKPYLIKYNKNYSKTLWH